MTLEEHLCTNYLYDPHTGLFLWLKEGAKFAQPAFTTLDVYYQARVMGKKMYAHRAAFVLMGKVLPKIVDHKNRVKTDNRWINLRPASVSINNLNRGIRSDNTTGAAGISPTANGKFEVRFCKLYIGTFDTLEKAVNARNSCT